MKDLVRALFLVVACDPAPAPTPAPEKTDAPTKTATAKPATLPPAPDGATILGKLYVQTCAIEGSCPSLLQPAGETHCKALGAGGLTWRLPTHDELKSWRGKPGLSAFDGFHWSSTPFADAADQVWIFDPTSGSETTIPKDRKPFTVRCVATP